jgi:hypothetical protein
MSLLRLFQKRNHFVAHVVVTINQTINQNEGGQPLGQLRSWSLARDGDWRAPSPHLNFLSSAPGLL